MIHDFLNPIVASTLASKQLSNFLNFVEDHGGSCMTSYSKNVNFPLQWNLDFSIRFYPKYCINIDGKNGEEGSICVKLANFRKCTENLSTLPLNSWFIGRVIVTIPENISVKNYYEFLLPLYNSQNDEHLANQLSQIKELLNNLKDCVMIGEEKNIVKNFIKGVKDVKEVKDSKKSVTDALSNIYFG